MPAIKSLDELKKIREEAIKKKEMKTAPGKTQVIVAMGTCGIAAGARDTMRSILNYVEGQKVSDVTVTQTGCIGLCEHEPIVEVIIGEQPKVYYRKVNVEVAERIMREHVQGGKPVESNILPLQS
ncbi:MAG: (2Fe-2S) ferredoxin domain-containing protein [Anaerolineales bacterium]|jgi:NADP-reducing hydrogenase subunit HndB|nr:(2Fe-2S) ferredoxin domain-containing protein [Anaerolineales bacterium]